MPSIKPSEWALFYKLLGNLLMAGHTPVESLSMLLQEPLSAPLKERLQPQLPSLPPTASLADCLKLKVFALDATMLGLFEKTTCLEQRSDLLQALSARYAQAGWIARMRGNSFYWPLLYFGVGGSMFVLLIYKVLPSFATVYQESGVRLPAETTALMALKDWIFLLLALFMACFLAMRFRPAPLRGLIDRLRLIRPWGILHEKIAIARFTHMLTVLLSKNISPYHALMISASATGNTVLEHRLQRDFSTAATQQAIDVSLAGVLKTCPLIPAAFAAAFGIAEKTQGFNDALPELMQMSSDQLFQQTQALNNYIDAVSKFFVALFFAWVALAVYRPLFNLGALI